MSVLVKNMEMPKTCWGCQFGDDCGETVHCNITGESQIADKRHDCPLIEIPTPHGRLIDADEMCADLATVDPRYGQMVEWSIRVTEAQKTVIEAEE